MNQIQINQLEMFQTTIDYLDAQSTVWNSVPIIGNYKNQLTTITSSIHESADEQASAQIFIGKSIQSIKKTIAEKLDLLDDLVEAYAVDTKNSELAALMSNTKTDYLRLTHEEFDIKTRQVVTLLEEHLDTTLDYGLTAEQIEDVKLDLDQFLSKRGKPRAYQVASRQATQSLESLFDEGRESVEKLDRVLKRYKRANASFYNGYTAARKVVND